MKKNLLGILSIILAASIFTACGSKSASFESASSNGFAPTMEASKGDYIADEDYGYDDYDSYDYAENAGTRGTGSETQTPEVADTNRKLIKTVRMSVETKEFDPLMKLVESKVSELGGYVENSEVYNGSRYYTGYNRSRNASMVIRIPQNNLNSFVYAVSDVANVTNKSESVQDITLQYVDVKSHKEALDVEYDRLLALLEKAESMEDILTIEDRMTSVRYQLQSMESQIRTYDNQVNYSTVNLDISEVEELTPVVEETVGERIAGGFADSLSDVWRGLVDFFVGFIVAIPYLVVWAVILGIVAIIALIIVKKSKKNREKRVNEAKERMSHTVNDVIGAPKKEENKTE